MIFREVHENFIDRLGDFVIFNIPVYSARALFQLFDSNGEFEKYAATLSNWLPRYPANLRNTSIVWTLCSTGCHLFPLRLS